MWYTCTFLVLCVCIIYTYRKCNKGGPNKFKYYMKYLTYYMSANFVSGLMIPYCILRLKDVRNANVGTSVAKHITKLIGIKWYIRRGEILAEDRAAVIIANHQNTLDILGIVNIWHIIDKAMVVSKKELFYVWPFGLYTYLSRVLVFIDRNNPKKAYKQLQSTSQIIVKDKIKLIIYPEGTRNSDHTKLKPFKKGAFMLAVEAQVPIIPIVYSPYYFVNNEKHIFNTGHIVIQCLDPVSTKGLTKDDVPILIEQLHEKMSAVYKELSQEIYNSLPEGNTST